MGAEWHPVSVLKRRMSERFISISGSRPLDEIPWSDGTGFSSTDWKKFDLAMRRFWENKQLAYRGGEKIRTNISRNRASKTIFDVIWNPEKQK